MSVFHTSLLYLHIALGAVALLLYWLPVITRKGSKLHINAGKVFYYLMLIVSGSGIVMSLMGLYDPVGIYTAGKQMTAAQIERMLVWRIPLSQFLLLLSLLTWVTVRHAIGVLLAKANRNLLKRLSFLGPVLLMLPLSLFVAPASSSSSLLALNEPRKALGTSTDATGTEAGFNISKLASAMLRTLIDLPSLSFSTLTSTLSSKFSGVDFTLSLRNFCTNLPPAFTPSA